MSAGEKENYVKQDDITAFIQSGFYELDRKINYSEQEIEQRLSRLNLSGEEKEEIGRLLRLRV